jgi:pimeloyl-ACP methyl ester carboxylesterase
MARFVLVPGAGSDSWYWHRVVPLLAAAGHDPVAIDFPLADPNAGFVPEYIDAVVDACAGASDGLAIIGQSLGGFSASAACAQVDADLLGLVCAMVPVPGETFDEWWTNTGFEEPEDWDTERMFLHDLPADVAKAIDDHGASSVGRGFEDPWPLDGWPDVRTRFVLGSGDRLFPADFQRRVVAERLPGVVPDEIDTGHLPALARPAELTELLLAWWAA